MSNQVERRPFLIALAALSIGIACRGDFPALIFLIPLLALARSVRSWSIVLICLVGGYLISPPVLPTLKKSQPVPGPARIVREGLEAKTYTRAAASVNGLNVSVIAPAGTHLHPGELIRGPFIVQAVAEAAEPYAQDHQIQGTLVLRNVELLQGPNPVFSFADGVRDDFRQFVEGAAGPDEASWIEAMWLGRGMLARGDVGMLEASGGGSLFSQSGLHVYILCGVLVFLFSSLIPLDRRIQLGLLTAVLGLYCLLTGLQEATLRASLACLILSFAYLFSRETDIIAVTAFCGCLYLLFFPRAVGDLGFQLSMLIPIAIALYMPAVRLVFQEGRRHFLWAWVKQIAGFVIVVWLAAEPLIVYHGGEWSFGMLFSSFVLAAAAPILLGSVLVAYGLRWTLPMVGAALIRDFLAPLVAVLHNLFATTAAILPHGSFLGVSALWIYGYYGLWLMVWRQREVRP